MFLSCGASPLLRVCNALVVPMISAIGSCYIKNQAIRKFCIRCVPSVGRLGTVYQKKVIGLIILILPALSGVSWHGGVIHSLFCIAQHH